MPMSTPACNARKVPALLTSDHDRTLTENKVCCDLEGLNVSSMCHVANFEFCATETCSFSAEEHLVITMRHIRMTRNSALAISYTWGEFDRRDIAIGHSTGGEVVHLNLGTEWVTQDLVCTLATLCLGHAEEFQGLWIDQLCIPQKDQAEIRRTLASIPTIYRTLDVVVLMPGSTCECFQKTSSELAAAFGTDIDVKQPWTPQNRAAVTRWENQLKVCLNASGPCSYFDRIWTRQELSYSRRVRLAWVADEQAVCVADEDHAHLLSPFASKLFERCEAQSFTKIGALNQVGLAHARFISEGTVAMEHFKHLRRKDGGFDSPEVVLSMNKFLSGDWIESGKQSHADEREEDTLNDFLYHLGTLSLSKRAATKAYDYVAAVWVDCPQYKIPERYRTMGLPSLLEDAIQQLESNFCKSIMVNAPTGLFCRSSAASALWRPSQYLHQGEPSKIDELYGVLARPYRFIPVTAGQAVPILMFGARATGVSSRARDYLTTFSGLKTGEVLKTLKGVLSSWPLAVFQRIQRPLVEEICQGHEYSSDRTLPLFFKIFLVKDMMQQYRIPLPRGDLEKIISFKDWTGLPEIDHYQAVYKLVIDALGLDTAICQKHDLKLMVSTDHPACIGVTNQDLGQYQREDYDPRSWENAGCNVTVCTRDTGDDGRCWVEAKRSNKHSDHLAVTGVWVPYRYVPLHDMGALVTATGGMRNASLGGPDI